MKRSVCLAYLFLFYRPMTERMLTHFAVMLFNAPLMGKLQHQNYQKEVDMTLKPRRPKSRIDARVLKIFYAEEEKRKAKKKTAKRRRKFRSIANRKFGDVFSNSMKRFREFKSIGKLSNSKPLLSYLIILVFLCFRGTPIDLWYE